MNNRERKAAELDARTREVGVRLAELSAAPARDVLREVNPVQKARIVRALKADGHTVGFLGDGINDAAALREADVGVSVDTAVDIAKESADVILLEKDLMVLVASAFLPFQPMLAIHLLVQNLCYDISQLSIPWDRMAGSWRVCCRRR